MADYDVPANPGSWGNMPFPGQSDPQGMFAPNTAPAANSMPFPGQFDPRGVFAPRPAMAPRVLRNPAPAAAPLPLVRPNINVPVGQVAQSGSGSLWDALRALFSGQPAAQAQAQGMTGMLQSPRGQGARGTDALGNPFNRFG